MDAHRPRLRAAAAVALVAVLTACGGADGGGTTERPEAPVSTPAAVSGELLQFRRDVARQRVEVRLTATADGLVVEALTLLAPGLSAGPGDPRSAELRPGVPVDLPVGVGGDCAVDVGPPTALVRLRDAAGSVREVTVPLADDGLVRRLHEGYCFEQELLRQVAVEVVDLREVACPAL